MEGTKEIRRHKMLGYALTGIEGMVLVVVIGQAVRNPLGILLNPPQGFFRNLCSVRTVMLWIGICLYLIGKIGLDAGRTRITIFLYYFVSQTLFLGYFATQSSNGLTGGSMVSILPGACSIYNTILSISLSSLQAYGEDILWTRPRYTRVRGLFNYMGKSIGVVMQDMLYLYTSSTGMAIGGLGMYLTVSRTLFPWIRFGAIFQPLNETPWKTSKSIFLANMSIVAYLFLVSVVDRLLAYNMSLMNLSLANYWYKEEEDIRTLRLRFFQISELSMRYPEVLRRIARSNRSMTSLGLYIRREESEILKVMEMMRKEKEALESKMWFSVPQISQPLDKPKALVMQRRIQFVKRIRSYNFIEILGSRIGYFCKIWILINRYRSTRRSFLLVKSFMKFLEKYKGDYLLVKDLEEAFESVMKHLHNEVSDTEEVIGRGLESDLFCK
ncbi:hypothetical protein EROM_060690 [Encephalitozoon romaleae SJ-2008]|uniref:Uncharacterized protein n=1 Tax=Encephalitozoon romaleae (strain SJ-2008) TaxID=1178016 RepID=I7AS16_ENCRO|nr:hypothetical protein EROM_060690 [Encephalitozoon romaleae SJ-2008]AFN83162.1 hypothetical protein EROM_060690 [Encephalitozoon romaleae SJ-2008]